MHAEDYNRNIRNLRNDRSRDPGSGQNAPGFSLRKQLMENASGRSAKILPSMIRIITLKEENQSEKSDAQLQLHTGRTEINLVGSSPFLIV